MKKSEIEKFIESYRKLKAGSQLSDVVKHLMVYMHTDAIESLQDNDDVNFNDFCTYLRAENFDPDKRFDAAFLASPYETSKFIKRFKESSVQPAMPMPPPAPPKVGAVTRTPSELSAGENNFLSVTELNIIGNLPNDCQLNVPIGTINIKGSVGANCRLKAGGKVTIDGSIGNDSTIETPDLIYIGADVRSGCALKADSIIVNGSVTNSLAYAEKRIEIKGGNDKDTILDVQPGGEILTNEIEVAGSIQEPPKEQEASDHEFDQELNNAFHEQLDEINEAKFSEVLLKTLDKIPDVLPEPLKEALVNLYNALSGNDPARKILLSSLRPHQRNFLIEYCNALNNGQKDAVVAQATGSGKTVEMAILSELLMNKEKGKKSKNKILILVPKVNLSRQTLDKYKKFAPNLKIALYPDDSNALDADVVVMTLQAAWQQGEGKGLEKVERGRPLKEHFTMAFFDEAHNFLGEVGTKRVVKALRDLHVACLAFTATPIIDNKKPKDDMVTSCYQLLNYSGPQDNPIKPYTIVMAEEQGQLAPVVSTIVRPRLDELASKELRKLGGGTKAAFGEINENKVGLLINTEKNNRMIADIFANGVNPVTKERYLSQVGITFAAGINHAEDLKNAYNKWIPIEGNVHIMQRREAYVDAVHKRELAEYLDKQRDFYRKAPSLFTKEKDKLIAEFNKRFSREKVAKKFCVAEAVHSGRYSVILKKDDVAKALKEKKITYTNKSTGEVKIYQLAGNEWSRLNEEYQNHHKEDNYPFKVFVTQALTEEQEKEIYKRYADGGIMMLVGADKLIEGFDNPKTKLVIGARPTRSQKVVTQTAGRGIRIDEDNPDAVANYVAIDYGISGQVFFPDIANDKWRLGNLANKKQVDHSFIPEVVIPDKTLTGGYIWESDRTFSLQHGQKQMASKKATVTERQIQDKTISLNGMIDDVTDVMNDLTGIVSKLDERLGNVTHVQKSTKTVTAEPRNPSTIKQSIKPRFVHFSASSPITRGFDRRLEKLMGEAEKMNQKLQAIIDEIEAVVNEDEEKQRKPKQRRTETSPTAAEKPVRLPDDSDQNAKDLMTTVAHLHGLQAKLKMIAAGGLRSYGGTAPMETNNPGAASEAALEADFSRVQLNLAKLGKDLNDTVAALNVDDVVKKIEATKASKAKKQSEPPAPLVHKPISPPTAEVEAPAKDVEFLYKGNSNDLFTYLGKNDINPEKANNFLAHLLLRLDSEQLDDDKEKMIKILIFAGADPDVVMYGNMVNHDKNLLKKMMQWKLEKTQAMMKQLNKVEAGANILDAPALIQDEFEKMLNSVPALAIPTRLVFIKRYVEMKPSQNKELLPKPPIPPIPTSSLTPELISLDVLKQKFPIGGNHSNLDLYTELRECIRASGHDVPVAHIDYLLSLSPAFFTDPNSDGYNFVRNLVADTAVVPEVSVNCILYLMAKGAVSPTLANNQNRTIYGGTTGPVIVGQYSKLKEQLLPYLLAKSSSTDAIIQNLHPLQSTYLFALLKENPSLSNHPSLIPLHSVILLNIENHLKGSDDTFQKSMYILIGFGASKDKVDDGGNTPFHLLMSLMNVHLNRSNSGREMAVRAYYMYRWLLRLGFDPEKMNHEGKTPYMLLSDNINFTSEVYLRLHLAEKTYFRMHGVPIASKAKSDLVFSLVRINGNAEVIVKQNNIDKVLKLIKENPRLVFLQDDNGDTILHHVIRWFSNLGPEIATKFIIQLLSLGVDPYSKNNAGISALDLLQKPADKLKVEEAHHNFVKNPAEVALSVFKPKAQVSAPVPVVAVKQSAKVSDLEVTILSLINAKDYRGLTAVTSRLTNIPSATLKAAAKLNDAKAFKILIHANSNYLPQINEESLGIAVAMQCGSPYMLISRQFNYSECDKWRESNTNNTILHLLAQTTYPHNEEIPQNKIIDYVILCIRLLSEMQERNTVNKEGKTALEIAHPSIKPYLTELIKAPFNPKNNTASSSDFAVRMFVNSLKETNHDLINIGKHLLLNPNLASINFKNGDTLMHTAVIKNSLSLVKLLSLFNVDINAKNSLGETPFMANAKRGLVNAQAFEHFYLLGADPTLTDNYSASPLSFMSKADYDKVISVSASLNKIREERGFPLVNLPAVQPLAGGKRVSPEPSKVQSNSLFQGEQEDKRQKTDPFDPNKPPSL